MTLRWLGLPLAIAAVVPSAHGAEDTQVRATTEAVRPARDGAIPPPRVRKAAMGLSEAVQLTMTHDPKIQRARQDVAGALGQAQTARGAFDPILRIEPSFTATKQESFPFVAALERQKRQILRDLSLVFTDAAERLREQLELFDLTIPPCPDESDIEDLLESDPLEREDRARQTGLLPENVIINLGGVEQEIDAALQLCDPNSDTGLTFDRFIEIIGGIDDTPEFDLSDLLTEAQQLQRERIALTQNSFELVGTRTALAFKRLGEAPDDEETKGYAIEGSFLKPFRTGTRWSVGARFESTERNFDGKPLDPAFGGRGIPNQFPSFVSTSFDIPLGRGGSRRSVQAPERAAEQNLDAQREIFRHIMAGEVVSTILAYLDLAAAQETAELLEGSAERQSRVVDITRQLIEGGDVAQVDLARAQARLATVRGAVATANRRVSAARFVLANAIGLRVETEDDAPLAADRLPAELAAIPAVDVLVDEALRERRDYRGLGHLRDASEILAVAAKVDLKHEIDFFVSGGLSTLYESPFFRYIPDEQEDPPRDSAVHYDEVEGYWRSVTDTWDPFVTIGLRMRFPFKNNVAKGRYARERASHRKSQIEYADTERVIRDNVVSAATALDHARRAIERRRAAIENLTRTMQAALDLFDDGEINLIDTLTTEENLTSEQLALVRNLQQYHSLLARLRFDTGSVLEFDDEGTLHEAARFDPEPFGGQSG